MGHRVNILDFQNEEFYIILASDSDTGKRLIMDAKPLYKIIDFIVTSTELLEPVIFATLVDAIDFYNQL